MQGLLASLGIFNTGTGARCLGDLEGEVCRGERGRIKMESRQGGKKEKELLFNGLWLAYIINYLGWAPAHLCWAESPVTATVTVKRIVNKILKRQSLTTIT